MERTSRSDARLDVTVAPEPPTAATLATAICDRIRSDILAGRRKPGGKLRLEALKSEFAVSWSPIREALSRLAAEGLVQAEEQRGYRVAPVSKSQLAEVIRLRTLLESMALQASIERGDDAWEADVLAAHHRLSKLENRRYDSPLAEQWERWHRTFHEILIRACGMTTLLQFCGQLHDMNDRYRRLFLSAHKFDRDVAGEHRAITEATLSRNAGKACRLLEAHIQRTGRNILQSMKL
jgi:GntR family transcriptional regulator, carbon starvation induced regulator